MAEEKYRRLAELEREGKRAVVVTVVAAEGPVPREAGAWMVVFPDGSGEGTIGGGALERTAAQEALGLMRSGKRTLLRTYDLEGLGMVCGGRATLYYELLAPPAKLHILGTGHVGRVLWALAREALPFEAVAYDVRGEVARETGAVLLESYGAPPGIKPGDYVFICTHDHEEDYRAVKAVLSLEAPPAYVGLVGSRPKWDRMKARLLEEGVPPERVESVRCPVGIPLGGKDPGTIAVSALAEILAHYHKSRGG